MPNCIYQRDTESPAMVLCKNNDVIADRIKRETCECCCPFHTSKAGELPRGHEQMQFHADDPNIDVDMDIALAGGPDDVRPEGVEIAPGDQVQGVGDLVAKGLELVGITPKRVGMMMGKNKPCGGCQKRKEAINKALPFIQDKNAEWTTVVNTAPREWNTLRGCIHSLVVAGWEPVIFAEPGSREVSGIKTFTNSLRLGVWWNFIKAARWALDQGKPYILTVQDDIVIHPDSKVLAEACMWPHPDTAFLSLYTPKHYSTGHKNGAKEIGVNRIVTGSLWGACALVWKASVLEKVLDHEIAKNWVGVPPKAGPSRKSVMKKRAADPALIANSDTCIGKCVNRLKQRMYFVDPSPANHVALTSSIAHGGNKGRRNCSRCADHSVSLFDQLPLPAMLYNYDGSAQPTASPAFDNAAAAWFESGMDLSMACTPLLFQAIEELVQPGHKTLEFGSGLSTLAFSRSGSHVALEQDPVQALKVIDATHSPIKEGSFYDYAYSGLYDIILIDGPYGHSRQQAVEVCREYLRPGGTVFVDDTHRKENMSIAKELASEPGADLQTVTEGTKQWAAVLL